MIGRRPGNPCGRDKLFDLTLMFGAGNEPATVAEFEKLFPRDYYDYNAGEVIPFAGQNRRNILYDSPHGSVLQHPSR